MTLSTFDHFNVIDVTTPTTHSAFDNFNISLPTSILPEAPTDLAATPFDASVLLTWTAAVAGTAQITGYHAVATPSAGTTLHYSLGTGTSVVLIGMTNDIEYTITLYAVTAVGDGQVSDGVDVTPTASAGPPDGGEEPPADTVPDAPVLDSLTPSNAAIGAYWTPPVFDGGAEILTYRIVAISAVDIVTVDTDGSNVSSLVGPLTNDEEYSVTVQAINVIGGSAESNALTETPTAGLPPIVDIPGFEPPPGPAAYREPDPSYAAFPYNSPFTTSSWIDV